MEDYEIKEIASQVYSWLNETCKEFAEKSFYGEFISSQKMLDNPEYLYELLELKLNFDSEYAQDILLELWFIDHNALRKACKKLLIDYFNFNVNKPI